MRRTLNTLTDVRRVLARLGRDFERTDAGTMNESLHVPIGKWVVSFYRDHQASIGGFRYGDLAYRVVDTETDRTAEGTIDTQKDVISILRSVGKAEDRANCVK